ncbi:hypothetical protein M3Y94_01180900 [Aphelenchoides besseyi]|nr:hypothetical protein M3Y94_01180900 [Aphelenchoides besseyi]
MSLTYASRLLLKFTPVDATKTKCSSYGLMLASGLIQQTGKGLFAFLPVGQRILDKTIRLIEKELNDAGAQKCTLPALGSEELWSKCGRWNVYGTELFRLEDRMKRTFCLQPTYEEMISDIAAQFGVFKTESLPMLVYQTTEKFRDEMNPRFGLLRSRHFHMNDLYSFDRNEEDAVQTYQRISDIYRKIFVEQLGLTETLVLTADAKEMGGNVSHEYHLPNESAEDRLLVCGSCRSVRIGAEIENKTCAKCEGEREMINSVEIGHTFQLGFKYSSVFNARSSDQVPYFMCCFGIGVTRLIAASIDVLSPSTTALRLPNAIAPFKLAIVLPKTKEDHPSMRFARDLAHQLASLPSFHGDVLVDDRTSKSVGRRLIELNQLGIPNILVVPAKKSTNPHDLIELEYFRTHPRNDQLNLVGLFSHRDIFQLLHH